MARDLHQIHKPMPVSGRFHRYSALGFEPLEKLLHLCP